LGGIFLEGPVEGSIGKLFEDFVFGRVVLDYRGGSLVSRTDQNEEWR